MKRYFRVMTMLLVSAFVLSSCHSAKLRDANEQYDRGEYNAAAITYRKIYNKLTKREERQQRGEVAYKMGLCYKALNQGARAEAAFANAMRYEYPDSMQLLYLAQAQHMQGKWATAAENYKAFLEKVPNNALAEEGLRGCEQAAQMKRDGSRYIVKQAKMFNSQRADFAPQYLDGQNDIIYFTSSTEKAKGTNKSAITGTKNSDIFFSKKDEKGNWQRPEAADGELNTDADEGNAAFTPDGSTMYFALAEPKANAASSVAIYTSQRSEAKWSKPVKFEITADTLSAYDDPAVSSDGKYLYFSSDMPGGQGGKDLWRINLKDSRGTLENLGDQINTPGDERYPYSRGDSVLYFSSSGHAGMGGLDIYKATLQPSGKWFIEAMPAPVNSSYDDFGITFAAEGEKGFFSSNRGDARGYDHIFSFEKPDLKITISGYVLDKDEEPVPNAVIRIVGNDGSNQKTAGKPDGSFSFNLQRGISYVMLAGAEGYLNGKQQFTSDEAEEDAEYNVDFVLAAVTKPQVIENIFYDFDKATLREESQKSLDEMVQIMNDNPNIAIEMASHTDRVGTDAYNDDLSQRRAKSVVDYLVSHGISAERLQPHGYGKHRPKTVTKRIARLYPQFKEGDVLNEEYVSKLSKEDQEAADQVNRRTEFQVLTTTYQMY